MIEFFLATVLYPSAAAAILALLAPGHPDRHPRRASILLGLAVVAGWVAAMWRHDGAPVLPPVAAQHWVPVLAAGGFALGAILDAVRPPRTTRPAACFHGALPVISAATGASLVAMFSYTAKYSQPLRAARTSWSFVGHAVTR